MDALTIESQYSKILAFNYGNIDKLIEQLSKGLKLYINAKNQNHPKVKYRIELYTKIIEYGNTCRNIKTPVSIN
jgi:hypothetical protein